MLNLPTHEFDKRTVLDVRTIATGRDGLERWIPLTVRATIPCKRCGRLAISRRGVPCAWCVRVDLRLRDGRDRLTLRGYCRGSKAGAHCKQRGGGRHPETQGGHDHEGWQGTGAERDVRNARREVREVEDGR